MGWGKKQLSFHLLISLLDMEIRHRTYSRIFKAAKRLYILLSYYGNKYSKCLKDRILLEGGKGLADPGCTSWGWTAFWISLWMLPYPHCCAPGPDAAAGPAQAGAHPCSRRSLASFKCRAVCSQQKKIKPCSPCANQQHMDEFCLHDPRDFHSVRLQSSECPVL